MTRQRKATIDPELRAQLARAAELKNDVAVTFTLRNRRHERTLDAESANDVAQAVVERAAQETQSKPKEMNVFPYVQSFVVSGPPDLIQAILKQPEVDSATANYQSEDLLIRPVEVREVPAKRLGFKPPASLKKATEAPQTTRKRRGAR